MHILIAGINQPFTISDGMFILMGNAGQESTKKRVCKQHKPD